MNASCTQTTIKLKELKPNYRNVVRKAYHLLILLKRMAERIIPIRIYLLLHNIVKAAKRIVAREIHTIHLKIPIIKISLNFGGSCKSNNLIIDARCKGYRIIYIRNNSETLSTRINKHHYDAKNEKGPKKNGLVMFTLLVTSLILQKLV